MRKNMAHNVSERIPISSLNVGRADKSRLNRKSVTYLPITSTLALSSSLDADVASCLS
jgi:hypothetical protein